jgi:dimethylhistidine N-methyltransferase
MQYRSLAFSDDETQTFASDVIAGLSCVQKRIPAKYFYDLTGSRLFERIIELPEYYPARCELEILNTNATAITDLFPAAAALVEFGSGSSKKARILAQATRNISAYVPVDISMEFLTQEAAGFQRDFPQIEVFPVAADFVRPFKIPGAIAASPRVGFFPGSTIGNFDPLEVVAFLRHAQNLLGRDAILIVGVDLIKRRDILHAAYNDADGVTARFNLNLLARMNKELGADFDLSAFKHDAFYNDKFNRIEMHLVSLLDQTVNIADETISFRRGESIHTENSYKYTVEAFGALAQGEGWAPVAAWLDAAGYFSVHALKHSDVFAF